jgi:CheY-like chemotaxis protein
MSQTASTLEIAVINDKKSYADTIVRDLRSLGCDAEAIVEPTAHLFLAAIKDRVEKQERQYDGVVLDIMFSNESMGGVELWKEVESAGLASALGLLMVLTNSDSQEEITSYFESIGRPIRVLSGATASAIRRKEDLELFVSLIRESLRK